MSDLEIFAGMGKMVEDIVSAQGKEPIQLELYRRLIEKTGPTASTAISQHINAFNIWYTENEEAIKAKDHTNISHTSRVSYNDKVYLPMRLIFDRASDEDRKVIWLHIYAIRAKSSTEARDQLKEMMDNKPTEKGMSFIDQMMKDIESEMSKIVNTVNNHPHSLDPIKTDKTCSLEGCDEPRILECVAGCDWGLCEDCFDEHKKDTITEKTTPLEAIEKLAAGGGFSRLMKGFTDKAQGGSINPMELIGSLQSYSETNGGPDMGSMMAGLAGGMGGGGGGGGGDGRAATIEDMF
jgi:hypothetical protein